VDIKEVGLVNPASHWYYQSKLTAVRQLLPVLPEHLITVDVGAGSGFFGINAAKDQPNSSAIFIDPEYKNEVPESLLAFQTFSECPHKPGNLYLLIDVLEHVVDDVELLSHFVREAKADSTFIITVPAFMALWSPHDDFLEHKRRYTRRELEKVVMLSGLVVEQSQYLFSVLTPIIFLIRKVKSKSNRISSDMREMSAITNSVLRAICNFEHKYLSNRLFGLSVIIRAKKPISRVD
jgi:hypothetical protein